MDHYGTAVSGYVVAVANARFEHKDSAIIVAKQASGSAKIDPMMRRSTPLR